MMPNSGVVFINPVHDVQKKVGTDPLRNPITGKVGPVPMQL